MKLNSAVNLLYSRSTMGTLFGRLLYRRLERVSGMIVLYVLTMMCKVLVVSKSVMGGLAYLELYTYTTAKGCMYE